MANELAWLRSKATRYETDTLVISATDAATAECEPGTYKIERFSFVGAIPIRMARALRGCRELIQTDVESEVLHLGNGYVSGQGQCRYYRTTYTLAQ